MGFKPGAYAKVWNVKPVSDTKTDIKISISYKDKNTGEYKPEFDGFVSCCGFSVAKAAANLNAGDRIKLGDVDMVRIYNKETKTNFECWKLFSFDVVSSTNEPSASKPSVEDIEEEGENEPDERLPF